MLLIIFPQTFCWAKEKNNFHEIEWKPIDKNSPATLDYLIKDYFGHMYHHLKQIMNY